MVLRSEYVQRVNNNNNNNNKNMIDINMSAVFSPGLQVVQQVVSDLRLLLVKLSQHVQQHREAAVIFLHGDQVPEDQADGFGHGLLQRPAESGGDVKRTGAQRRNVGSGQGGWTHSSVISSGRTSPLK